MAEEKEFGFVRGNVLQDLSALDYYKRTEEMIKLIDEQIELAHDLTKLPEAQQFKNPREEASYLHDVKTLSVLKRQRERLKQKLVEIQVRIQEDIEVKKQMGVLKNFTISPKEFFGEVKK